MAVNFYLDKRTDRKGMCPIRVSIIVRGARLLTSSGYKIAPDRWDSVRQISKKAGTNAAGFTSAAINQGLCKIQEHFAAYEGRSVVENFVPTIDDLKGAWGRVFARRKSGATSAAAREFWGDSQQFISERSQSNQWTESTVQKFMALRRHLEGWRPQGRLTFEAFTESGLISFVGYLRDKAGHKNSTIGKQLGYLKWFLNWATAKGYNSLTDFKAFAPKLKTAAKKVIFLEWEELMRVYNFEVPEAGTEVKLRDSRGREYVKRVEASEGMRVSRDVFCFCCFTSLRFSDARNLRRANVQGDSMTLTTVKTSDTITIELNKFAKAILAKYTRSETGDYALPRISNQRMNEYLKDLCELCGINEPITRTSFRGQERIDEVSPKYELIGTHTGRRTFICNALMLGIPAEIVMKWTGHSDYKAMKPYIDVSNAVKAQQMDKFNQL